MWLVLKCVLSTPPATPSPVRFGDGCAAPRGFGEPEKRVERERGQSWGGHAALPGVQGAVLGRLLWGGGVGECP